MELQEVINIVIASPFLKGMVFVGVTVLGLLVVFGLLTLFIVKKGKKSFLKYVVDKEVDTGMTSEDVATL